LFSFLFNKLRTRIVGKIIKEFEQVDSTNNLAFEMADKGELDGAVITAAEQLHGKGRLGRSWVSSAGKGLYFSVILRPNIPPSYIARYSLGVGVALQHVLSRYYKLPALIKWPNDIIVNGKKIAGILMESRISGGSLGFIVAGIGINTNWDISDKEGEFRREPTALNLESGFPINHSLLLGRLLGALDAVHSGLQKKKWPRILSQARRNLFGFGIRAQVEITNELYNGFLEGLDDDGALLFKTEDGSLKTITSGEINFADRD